MSSILSKYPHPLTISVSSQKDDIIPLRYPIISKDGNTKIISLAVPKGTTLRMGVASVNTSTRIWGPDAGEWKPERWMKPLPATVVDAKIPGVIPALASFTTGGHCMR
jgi:hypothetical protein